jgi:transposase-like protein
MNCSINYLLTMKILRILTGEEGLFKKLKKALIERALGAELTEHLGYEKRDPAGRGSGNSRNGSSAKTVLTQDGEIEIALDRQAEELFAGGRHGNAENCCIDLIVVFATRKMRRIRSSSTF